MVRKSNCKILWCRRISCQVCIARRFDCQLRVLKKCDANANPVYSQVNPPIPTMACKPTNRIVASKSLLSFRRRLRLYSCVHVANDGWNRESDAGGLSSSIDIALPSTFHPWRVLWTGVCIEGLSYRGGREANGMDRSRLEAFGTKPIASRYGSWILLSISTKGA